MLEKWRRSMFLMAWRSSSPCAAFDEEDEADEVDAAGELRGFLRRFGMRACTVSVCWMIVTVREALLVVVSTLAAVAATGEVPLSDPLTVTITATPAPTTSAAT